MASISFASESLMDPRIQVKLDKYQKCGYIYVVVMYYFRGQTDTILDFLTDLYLVIGIYKDCDWCIIYV